MWRGILFSRKNVGAFRRSGNEHVTYGRTLPLWVIFIHAAAGSASRPVGFASESEIELQPVAIGSSADSEPRKR